MSKNTKSIKPDPLAILQGLLFIAGEEGLTIQQLGIYLEMPKNETKIISLLAALETKLNFDQTSGLTILKVGTTYKLTTKQEHHQSYQVLQKQPLLKLSQAALETLAIIAYNQPVTKPRIEEIRGVNCDGIMAKLKSLNFITETGRSDLPGRPYLFSITQEFMDHFQIESLSQLPELPTFNVDQEQEIYNFSNE